MSALALARLSLSSRHLPQGLKICLRGEKGPDNGRTQTPKQPMAVVKWVFRIMLSSETVSDNSSTL